MRIIYFPMTPFLHIFILLFMVYLNCTDNSVYPVYKGSLTLHTLFIISVEICFSNFRAFISYSYLLVIWKCLEIILKNILEYLKFNGLNISHHCSWVALSSMISGTISGKREKCLCQDNYPISWNN